MIFQGVDKNIDQEMNDECHEFLRGYTRVVIKKLCINKDALERLEGLEKKDQENKPVRFSRRQRLCRYYHEQTRIHSHTRGRAR